MTLSDPVQSSPVQSSPVQSSPVQSNPTSTYPIPPSHAPFVFACPFPAQLECSAATMFSAHLSVLGLLSFRVVACVSLQLWLQVKDGPIRDWVKLAVTRSKLSGMPVIFWLDPARPHDAQLTEKVNLYLKDHDTTGLDIQIMSPVEATKQSLERIRAGKVSDVLCETHTLLAFHFCFGPPSSCVGQGQ